MRGILYTSKFDINNLNIKSRKDITMNNIFNIAQNYLKNVDIQHIRMTFLDKGEPLEINDEFINTLADDKQLAIETVNANHQPPHVIRWAGSYISNLESCASNDMFENQLSKILGIRNIDTKHGWDGNDDVKNEPYEYKPTKITGKNYMGSPVNINDDSDKKINNISKQKKDYNNENANFIISIIDKKLSDFICIYKFKESVLKEDRLKNLQKCISENKRRVVYQTSINDCINLSKVQNVTYYSWKNPKYF